MPRHASLDLEHFLPYRLSVLSNRISQAIAARYARRFGIGVTEWRVVAVLGRYPDLSAGEVAARIKQPTLLLWCKQDRVIDPSAMTLYGRSLPQATQVLLDGCGHMSLMERPHAVADAVVNWLTNDAKE